MEEARKEGRGRWRQREGKRVRGMARRGGGQDQKQEGQGHPVKNEFNSFYAFVKQFQFWNVKF
jgi:hypothetical protein